MTTPSVLLRLAAVAAGILLAAPPLARAAEDEPVVSIATKAIEVAVTIDETLKAHPGLWDDLLAEGRREAQKQRAEGPYGAFVPWTAFERFLSAEGAAMFGGERPNDDESND